MISQAYDLPNMSCHLVGNLTTTVFISAWHFVGTWFFTNHETKWVLRMTAGYMSLQFIHKCHQLVTVPSLFLWQSQRSTAEIRAITMTMMPDSSLDIAVKQSWNQLWMLATAGQLVLLTFALFSSCFLWISNSMCHIYEVPTLVDSSCLCNQRVFCQEWTLALADKWYISCKVKCNSL